MSIYGEEKENVRAVPIDKRRENRYTDNDLLQHVEE